MLIYLAAIESSHEHSTAAAIAGAKRVLTSFYYAGYIRREPRDSWIQCLRQATVRLADSGAFTLRTSQLAFQGSGSQAAAQANVDYDAFLDLYITWLKGLRRLNLLDFWIELDIGVLTSYDWVHRQRDKVIAAGLGGGLINVWHTDQDWDYWLYLLREAKRPGRSNYVAIEGNQLNRDSLDYKRFLREAYDRGVKVHAFRMTAEEAIARWPFYSVDSSSWITPASAGSYTMQTRTGGVINKRRVAERGDGSIRPSWYGVMPRKGTTCKLRVDCLVKSAKAWIDTERNYTATWLKAGVDWDAQIKNPKVTT